MPELQPGLERLAELHRSDPRRPFALVELVRYAVSGARQEYLGELRRLGGRLRVGARAELQLVGSAEADWDDFLIVEFPSRAGYVDGLASAAPLEGLLAARRCFAARPGPRTAPRIAALAAGLLRALGAGPPPRTAAQARLRLGAPAGPTEALGPGPEQLETFLAGEAGTPIVMFNLLAYRRRAHYAPPVHDGDVSGREAYRRYGRGIARLLLGVGARLLWLGRSEATLVGEPEAWDEFAVVGYPSRAAFLGLVTSPAYQAQLHHRAAGLLRTELVQCSPWPRPGHRADAGVA